MSYVYILKCQGDTLYTGYAEDLEARVGAHFEKKTQAAKFTKSHTPIRLLKAWELPDRSSALKLEASIKKLKKAQKLSLLVDDNRNPKLDICGQEADDSNPEMRRGKSAEERVWALLEEAISLPEERLEEINEKYGKVGFS